MKDSYCGEYSTYSQKVRNLMYSIIYYRGILNFSNMNSSNLEVIFKIEGILERLSKYKNIISENCQSALNNIRNIRSDNGSGLFKKRKKQLDSKDIDNIKGEIDEVIEIINIELPKEKDLDAIEIDLINKKYSNKQLGEAIRNHAREIVYVLCSENNAKNIIIEPSIGKKLEELLHYINDQRDNLAPQYSTPLDVAYRVSGLLDNSYLIPNGIDHSVVYNDCSNTYNKLKELICNYHFGDHNKITIESLIEIINPLINSIDYNIQLEKRTDKIQEIILAENFSHLEGAIARCSRKIAQTISSEMQLEENQNSHNGEAISTEDGANR